MARSESSAQELGRPADGKPTAGVGRVRSSGEAGNDRGAKGHHTKSVSNNFYILFDFVTEYETLLCAWEHVKANGGAPGVDGVTIQMIERSEVGIIISNNL